MEIVINRCYGGLCLSPLAVKMLADLDGTPCYFFKYGLSLKQYNPIDINDIEKEIFWTAFSVPNPEDYLPSDSTVEEYNKKYAEIAIKYARSEIDRTDKNLIKVVRELGKRAGSRFSELKIVEIPDGVEYIIDEYDGMETIQEKHRSWC